MFKDYPTFRIEPEKSNFYSISWCIFDNELLRQPEKILSNIFNSHPEYQIYESNNYSNWTKNYINV